MVAVQAHDGALQLLFLRQVQRQHHQRRELGGASVVITRTLSSSSDIASHSANTAMMWLASSSSVTASFTGCYGASSSIAAWSESDGKLTSGPGASVVCLVGSKPAGCCRVWLLVLVLCAVSLASGRITSEEAACTTPCSCGSSCHMRQLPISALSAADRRGQPLQRLLVC